MLARSPRWPPRARPGPPGPDGLNDDHSSAAAEAGLREAYRDHGADHGSAAPITSSWFESVTAIRNFTDRPVSSNSCIRPRQSYKSGLGVMNGAIYSQLPEWKIFDHRLRFPRWHPRRELPTGCICGVVDSPLTHAELKKSNRSHSAVPLCHWHRVQLSRPEHSLNSV